MHSIFAQYTENDENQFLLASEFSFRMQSFIQLLTFVPPVPFTIGKYTLYEGTNKNIMLKVVLIHFFCLIDSALVGI